MSIVANTIYGQLGGARFIAMTGARDFLPGEYSLAFNLPTSKFNNTVRCVSIMLDANDTYTMRFLGTKGFDLIELHRVSDVYCDKLQATFTQYTNLYISL
jgi:hypothetical protein